MKTEFLGSFSRSGTPCLGVGGGAYSNTLTGRMVLRPDGSKPHALFVKRHGDLACSMQQAIVPVQIGDMILTFQGKLPAERANPDVDTTIYTVNSITKTDTDEPVFGCEVVAGGTLDEETIQAIEEAIPWEALGTYHNRDGQPFVA